MSKGCSRKKLSDFLSKRLKFNDRLELLLHLEDCSCCRSLIFYLSKAQNPHYYQPVTPETNRVLLP